MAIYTLSLAISITDLKFSEQSLSRPTIFQCAFRYAIEHGMIVGAKKALVQGMFEGHVFMNFASATAHGFALDVFLGMRHLEWNCPCFHIVHGFFTTTVGIVCQIISQTGPFDSKSSKPCADNVHSSAAAKAK